MLAGAGLSEYWSDARIEGPAGRVNINLALAKEWHVVGPGQEMTLGLACPEMVIRSSVKNPDLLEMIGRSGASLPLILQDCGTTAVDFLRFPLPLWPRI
jgi:hypothetical protein